MAQIFKNKVRVLGKSSPDSQNILKDNLLFNQENKVLTFQVCRMLSIPLFPRHRFKIQNRYIVGQIFVLDDISQKSPNISKANGQKTDFWLL